MSDRAYFVSDLHLGSLEEPNAFVFLRFLKSVKSLDQMTHLFLLGDIFDLWISNHSYFKKKYSAIIDEWVRLRDLGAQIHYFEGNHDLYLKSYFQNELGFRVHEGPEYFQIAGLTVRVEHGDEMDPDDKGYIFLRWFLRTRLMKWLAPRWPEQLVVGLGERMSRTSRHYTSQVKVVSREQIHDMIRVYAERSWRERPFDLHISGHVHVMEDFNLESCARGLENHSSKREPSAPSSAPRVVNLGSWMEKPQVFCVSEDRVEFQSLESV